MAYQKITDLFIATAADYNPKSEDAYTFFKVVQNKLHYAISGHTAVELIYSRANSEKKHMGLTSWKKSPNGKIMESDVIIAKNYLNKEELIELIDIPEIPTEEPSFSIDFTELKNINPDVVGWIVVEGTQINYPIVQGKNNSFYLNHSLIRNGVDLGVFLWIINLHLISPITILLYMVITQKMVQCLGNYLNIWMKDFIMLSHFFIYILLLKIIE